MFIAKVVQNPENPLVFTLQFDNIQVTKDAFVRIRLVDAQKFFMPSYTGFTVLPVEGDLGSNLLQVTFNLPQILAECGATNLNSRVLEFNLVDNGVDEFIAGVPEFCDIEVKTPLVTYRLCLGKGKNLVLRLKWAASVIPSTMTLQEDRLDIELNTKETGSLILRRRIERNTVSYDRQTAYEPQSPNRYSILFQDLIGQMAADQDFFCFFYRIPASKTTPSFYYRVVTDGPSKKKKHQGYEFMACKIKDLTASVSISRQMPTVNVARVIQSSSTLSFQLSNLSPTAIKLRRIIKFADNGLDAGRTIVQRGAWAMPGDSISLLEWDNLHQRSTIKYQVLAEVDGEDYRLISETPYDNTIQISHQDIQITGDNNGFYIHISERSNKIRLGILGTCMTRWAFSRKYTDAYRDLYDVAFAHFWPSVFSLTEEPIRYPKQMFSDYTKTEQPYVRREYEKTSFQELQNADCEYVLIDFFVDAIHGPRKLKDGKFVGYKAYAKDFYQDYLMFDSEKYYWDVNDYFEHWTEAADRMIQALTQIVPQNRIILATGGLTHNFLSEEGKIECFDGMTLRASYMTKHSINALNYLWDKMNAYFMEKLPGAQVLSIREYDFLAFDSNAANVRPYHFVKAYYRALSAEMSRIILWDKQNP